MLKKKYSPEELQKAREEAERKARRGEIEPTHDFTFTLIGQFNGLIKLSILEFIFEDPTILDELDHLYKSDVARKLLFYYQPEEGAIIPPEQKSETASTELVRYKDKPPVKKLFITDGAEHTLTGYCMYFLRANTKRTLGEETFQRDILAGLINATQTETLLWNIERTFSNIFIPFLNSRATADRISEELFRKVKQELNPCLRSFASSLRVAEHVWGQGPLISEYPAEALTIKNLDDSMALLASEDGQERFETKVRSWMKNITDLLQEGEQLRLETDEQGPQDEIEFWKAKAAHLTLVVDEMMAPPTKMTLVTLRAAKCKLLKAWHQLDVRVARYHFEACDNAKFLGAMEKYVHAIYLEDPTYMKIPLKRLLNHVKMIFNCSTYFNNSVCVASLLVKITNQIIISCKRYITNDGRVTIWNQPIEDVERKLKECIELNNYYIFVYHKVKNGDNNREGRNFHFSEKYIFGKFEQFCTRLENLLTMFHKIQLFTELFHNRMGALLSEEAVEEDRRSFESVVSILKQREYDFLDYRNGKFDIDFVDFNRKITALTERVKKKLEVTYDLIWDTPHSFQYLERFETLSEKLPIGGMENKYKRMVITFKNEMDKILKFFKKKQNHPPLPRNYPLTSGRIQWVRSLLAHLQKFINYFEKTEKLNSRKEYRKLVKQFNDTGVILMKFEIQCEENKKNPSIRQVESMIARPVLKDQGGLIHLNFDHLLYNLLRECERLCKLDIVMPHVNQYLIKKKAWFLEFKDMVELMIENYHSTVGCLAPELQRLYAPHLNKIRACLEPGMAQINWTCASWQEFTEKTLNDVAIIKDMVDRANDIYTNRVEKLLESTVDVELSSLPEAEPWTIEEFVERIKAKCKEGSKELHKKSMMIEDAVEDLIMLALDFTPEVDVVSKKDSDEEEEGTKEIDLTGDTAVVVKKNKMKKMKSVMSATKMIRAENSEDGSPFCPSNILSRLDKTQVAVVQTAAKELRKNYTKKITEKLCLLMKTTLRSLAKYFQAATTDSSILEAACLPRESYQAGEIVFVLNTQLNIPKVEVRPSVEEIQRTLNHIGDTIVSVARGVGQWKNLERKPKRSKEEPSDSKKATKKCLYNPVKMVVPLIEELEFNFFKSVADTKDVTKSQDVLAICMKGFKLELVQFKSIWKKYSELWTTNKDNYIFELADSNPKLKEYERELFKYKRIEAQLLTEKDEFRYGTILISTLEFKETLKQEIYAWINLLTKAVHQKYKKEMENITGSIIDFDKKLDREIENLDDVRIFMETQKKIRAIEIDLDFQIETVENAYELIVTFGYQIPKEEIEKVENLNLSWYNLQQKAMSVHVMLLSVQEQFQEELVKNLAIFQDECKRFVEDYYKHGPMEEGLTPKQASDRLQMFQNHFEALWKKHSEYSVGEELFGLEHTEQPELNTIKKEINLLQKLYKLYNDVIESVKGYKQIVWAEINVEEVNNELLEFGNRCRKLPKALKEWPAFHALKRTIDEFNEICPMLELMSNKAMKMRHWEKIETITNFKFDIERKDLLLSEILEAPLLKFKEDIEDVCISALKEKEIEAKLRQITTDWTLQELSFQVFKNRGELLLRGDTTAETVTVAEDSLMVLGSLLSNRYNAPFKKQIQKWVNDLSNTNEILERWLLVQNMWVYLEAVFVGGDIAKQLPKEAKRFNKIDRSWQKIMAKAHDTPGVVNCCVGDENLKHLLPHMQEQLELCQKSLTGYLEKKRLMFPRFFFVSDPALLEILGQASDSHTIQAHLLSIFDNIALVKFHDQDYNKILSLISAEGEVVPLERPVRAEGSVESWLNTLLWCSQDAVHGVIRNCYHYINDNQFSLLEMVSKFQAQVAILGVQMVWTRDAENALLSCRQDKKIMGETNNKFLDILNLLIQQTTKNLDKRERLKYETMITIHMHQRDIFDQICKLNVKNILDFEWLKQARFNFKADQDKMRISITDVMFEYQNEYIGCRDRLVITPLTDRCYITLAQALGMCMGGAPAGPAGTGKTETVKDMAKTLGKYCVVFNCGDQMDYKGLGRIYKGLAQSGTWGCFDEFNRITLPVLSVAAQQIYVILSCKKDKHKEFLFTDGDYVDMNPEFGVFITMNPTYAGRQELPENMKIQFRNVAMMVPDRQLIMRVKMASCGFIENIILARKFFTLYKLCEEQLSKQIHYDFGLRNILSVLRTLGATKRECLHDTETTIVMRVLRDMNISKMVSEDEPLFLSLISDLFPNQKLDKVAYPELEKSIDDVLLNLKLVDHPPWAMKLIQLYETQRVRHGIMVLGPSGAGKTACINTLKNALTMIGKPHKDMRMNPKAITAGQMFGKLDVATNDWTDGIFAALWRKTMKAKKGDHHWIVLDGPVDPNWIENLNSVLDDSKILTLANGDRMLLPKTVKLLFEPQDLDNASPATVSRCGMVYMSTDGLDWKPMLESWLRKKELEPEHAAPIKESFNGSFAEVFKWAFANLHFVMNILQINVLHTLLVLLEAILPCMKKEEEEEILAPREEAPNPDNMDNDEDEDDEENEENKVEAVEEEEEEEEVQPEEKIHFDQCYLFALCWSFASYLEDSERLKLEEFLRTKTKLEMPSLAVGDSIFDYNINPLTGRWFLWTDELANYVPPDVYPQNYSSLLIPNVGSIRTDFLTTAAASLNENVLLIGEQGSAKTTLIYAYLKKKNRETHVISNSNFSSSTTPQIFQKNIEYMVDKRMGSIYGPPQGKTMTIFVDDLNLPEINVWGDQCTNEFFRSLIELGGFYNLERPGDFTTLQDIQYMAAMNHPGGGRNDIPNRLKRHFVTFNCTIPTDDAIDHIFKTIAKGHFNKKKGFNEEVIGLIQKLVPITRQLWKLTKEKLLPTPAKFHYVFNLRDLSRIWLGMVGTQSSIITAETSALHLWRHEVSRVIQDRFVSEQDKRWFDSQLLKIVRENLGSEMELVAKDIKYFLDFMQDAPEPTGEEDDDIAQETPKIYEPMTRWEDVIERLNGFLEQYNEILRGNTMDLVFFPDAIRNLLKISRIIRNPGGNMMLVGVGGSGKQSLTKLASFIAGYRTFQITLTRTYNQTNFTEDLKNLFRTTGITGSGTTFLFTDQDIKEESFLESINNVLAGGLLSALFTSEEKQEIISELIPIMKRECPKIQPTSDNVMQWFLDRIKANLHIVLCFSPVGEKFRSRALKFPGLISGCTINWLQPWPKDALVSVAQHFLDSFEVSCTEESKKFLYDAMASVQESVSSSCTLYFQRFRRTTHVTPKSFLNFIGIYKKVYTKQEKEIGILATRMAAGLDKLDEASAAVEELKKDLAVMERDLQIANAKSEEVLITVTEKARDAEAVKKQVLENKNTAENIVKCIERDKVIAEDALAAARPALVEAEEALNTIKPVNIATVRKLAKPPHLIMRVMDATMILFRSKMPLISMDPTVPCPLPSWGEALKVMSSVNFLSQLLNFPKDSINDEMVELLEPYLTFEDYNMGTAKRVCGDVAGLLCWTKAMSFFFGVNKEVLPLKAQLAVQEARYQTAMTELETAEALLSRKETELKKMQLNYAKAVREKQKLTQQAGQCRKKMSAASTLINGLGGEKQRWTKQCKEFKAQLGRLIGDALLACSFLSYSGPFNQEFRFNLLDKWKTLLVKKKLPFSENLNIIELLINDNDASEWSLQGLPSDSLSLENATIVTKAKSYPLLIDPQGQGKNWIKAKENDLQVTNLNHKYFKTHLEDSLSLGRSLLIEDVGEELDPVLDNLLEKNFVKQGKALKVMLGDQEKDVTKGFNLMITTKLSNPAYSPEISARCAIIDFTVTMKGLEDQLLGRVIKMEKTDLENERIKLCEDVIQNKFTMKELEDNLLLKLNSTKGSLVDDEELLDVLQDTKTTAMDVGKKLQVAAETEKKINAAREEFRAVATRGSILYFLIVELSKVNVMYQTSLKQFLVLFDISVTKSKATHVIEKRLANILDYLTKLIWKYTARGLYEKHKFLFTLLLALKIDMNSGHLSYTEFNLLLKGGASLDLNSVKAKPFPWMLDVVWLNIVELSKHEPFTALLDKINGHEKEWKVWFNTEAPEEEDIPVGYQSSLDVFRKLLLVRSWCPDRTMAQARKYIYDSLGADYLEASVLDLDLILDESESRVPLVCLLSTGSDPSAQIEAMAKSRGQECKSLALGQGQEEVARKMLNDGLTNGNWLMLQNCHLSLNFCDEIMQTMIDAYNINPAFRLWITTEVNKKFPIGLLQMSLKFTNEPPEGIRASMKRTYTDITQDNLDYSNHPAWPTMLYAVAFLHTIVQERRKYGPIGWNIPYEFNRADFTASNQFVMNHLDDLDPKRGISWQTIQFMLGEVQYGGRVTDDYDKRLLNTFTNVWFNETLLVQGFKFYEAYTLPECKTIEEYNEFISNLPTQDIPEVFGLHANADITYQINTAKGLLDQIIEIQPKESSGGSAGESREGTVGRIAEDMLNKLPQLYSPFEVKAALEKLGGPQPMNIFLKQEIDRMQRILKLIKTTLIDLGMAIEGTIIMDDYLKEVLDCMFDAKVPARWTKISWSSSTLGFWFTELIQRDTQFKTWCNKGRPKVFWMTGFFNPQGFLTAMKQEVTRSHKGWALDSVITQNLVTRFNKDEINKHPPEGVYIHGLFMEGANLDKRTGKLVESRTKILYESMPVIYIYAINTAAGKDTKLYSCPIYRKPIRKDVNYIGSIDFESDINPKHWVMRGVALLCDIK